MHPMGFEPAIAESERPKNHVVDRAVIGITAEKYIECKLYVSMQIRTGWVGEVWGVLYLVKGQNEAAQNWRGAILNKRYRNTLEVATSLKGINTIFTR